ncbi:MAG: tRNA pseudouridine(55) synthase TruB [Gammaproteobacteria bacterium]
MVLQRWPRRDVSGILLFIKSRGLSSNEALQCVKRLYQARKAGHTGSLDRLATGLLPICFGEATKLSGFLLNADKCYRAIVKLGVVTTTGDAEGEVVRERPVVDVDAARVAGVLRAIRGAKTQVPPMHSALKHRGQRLYELAHRGIAIERQPRPIVIHALDLVRFLGDALEITVRCSKGTYLRTLAEDIGEALGCGAHVAALERTAVGGFEVRDAIDLCGLTEIASMGLAALDARLLPLDCVLPGEPAVALSRDATYYLGQGQAVLVAHAPKAGLVKLYDDRRRFLGIGEVQDDGRIAPRRLLRTA